MPSPTGDELREKVTGAASATRSAASGLWAGARRSHSENPQLTRAIGVGVAVVVVAGIIVALSSGNDPVAEQPGRQALPAVSPTARPPERDGAPRVGSPPNPTAPPRPGEAAGQEPRQPAPPDAASPPDSGRPGAVGAYRDHQVEPGETLAAIALRNDEPFEQIAEDSGVADPNLIRPGQHLVVRGSRPGVEVIRPGSTLSKYASSTGHPVSELMRMNPQLTDPDRILAGGRLYV